MWLGLLVFLLYALVVLLLTALVAALLLAIGTALTLLFAVSVWEATVVALAVAAGATWLLSTSRLDDLADEDLGEPPGDQERPPLGVTDFPSRLRRRGKRRRQ
jgi:hypothetical protein